MAILKHYLGRFWEYSRFRAPLLIVLGLLAGVLRGIGFLMILPFLQILGIVDTGATMPRFVQTVVDQWRASPLPVNLTVALVGYVTLVSMVALLSYGESILRARIANGFIQTLRQDLFERLVRAPWTYLARIKRAELLQNIQMDSNQVHNSVNEFLMGVSSAVICLAYLVVALQLSIPLTLVCLAVGVAIAALLLPIRRRIESAAWQGRGAHVNMFAQIEERISMIKLVKSFAKEREETRDFNRLTEDYLHSSNRQADATALVPLCYAVVGALALSVIVVVAVKGMAVPPERVVILILIFSRIVPQISRLQAAGNRISGMLPALESLHAREQELAVSSDATLTTWPTPLPLQREIRFTNVAFTYPGAQNAAVKGLTLTIPAHQITALAGSSGAGKSTLADLTLSLLKPDRGQVSVDDIPLENDTVSRWRHSTAYMPQEQLLLHDTIRANLQWAKPDATDEELWTALRQASAEDFVRNLPQQLDTIVGERGAQLSGGERQRLSLARALMRSPSLLVLDEPTSALDDENEAVIHAALQKLKESTTVLLIAHRQSTLQVADRVIRLSDGRPADQPRQST